MSASWMFRYLLEFVSCTLSEIVNSPAVASAATTADVPSISRNLAVSIHLWNKKVGSRSKIKCEIKTYPLLPEDTGGIWDR